MLVPFLSFYMNWLITNWIEILGVAFALSFLYFEFKESAWLWPLAIVSSSFYIWIFYDAKIYADMSLQFYYVIISVYGWYAWRKQKGIGVDLKIHRISKALIFKMIPVFIGLYAILYFILNTYTDSPIPMGDAFTSAIAIIATWMLSRKILEQWILWVIANFVSVGLYFYRGMDVTPYLYIVYGIVSIAGYFEWSKKMRTP